jgi:hypothetical protein
LGSIQKEEQKLAKEYAAPIEAPEISTDQLIDGSYQEIESEYIERLAELAKQNGTSDLLGKEVRWQRGDGYARYMVWRTKPLELIWLDLGDAWSVEEALIRGLRVSDVRAMVERDENLRELFGRSTVEKN